ncbi:isoaspartyl peptidase/L-asparaginase-like [Vespa mandarinia]|uniref:isoaspartyl peptidase/L-asparaginase-like n=1 Tax=Vespa mandarinia TaxID=7446 RepID=UPI0016128B35|nr:isoaspartyl peptidase/L-asparaginase-like [Vespa mandarinia]
MSITKCHYRKNNSFKQRNNIDETFKNVTYNNLEKKCICQRDTNLPCIIVHGGVGNCEDVLVIEKMTACQKAASNGYKKLLKGGSSIEAVETALWWLECDEFFNCGYGSVLNEIGRNMYQFYKKYI